MDLKGLNWSQIIPALLLGGVLGGLAGFYFARRWLEKKAREMTAFMDKESLRQFSSMFGRQLSEQQLNTILAQMEKEKTKRAKNGKGKN